MLEMFRHKTWATRRLVEHCEKLADEVLDATAPGTFGTIRETLRHIVAADEGYLSILTRERFPSKAAAAAFVRPDRLPSGPVALSVLAERIWKAGPRWEALAQDANLPGRDVTTDDGWHLPASAILTQAVQHAAEHRAQIMSILGARGLELPGPNDLDGWGYAEYTGAMQELPPD